MALRVHQSEPAKPSRLEVGGPQRRAIRVGALGRLNGAHPCVLLVCFLKLPRLQWAARCMSFCVGETRCARKTSGEKDIRFQVRDVMVSCLSIGAEMGFQMCLLALPNCSAMSAEASYRNRLRQRCGQPC